MGTSSSTTSPNRPRRIDQPNPTAKRLPRRKLWELMKTWSFQASRQMGTLTMCLGLCEAVTTLGGTLRGFCSGSKKGKYETDSLYLCIRPIYRLTGRTAVTGSSSECAPYCYG